MVGKANKANQADHPLGPTQEASDLVSAFLAAAQQGDVGAAETLLKKGANANAVDPRTGLSALHYAAGSRAWQLIHALETTPGLNYLLKDRKGRLPSALAYEVAKDPEMGEYLLAREAAHAKRTGIDYRFFFSSIDETKAQDGFQVGCFVVHPAHGIGRIERLGEQSISGHSIEMMSISFPSELQTSHGPISKFKALGVRPLRNKDAVLEVHKVLCQRAHGTRENWEHRAVEYRAMIDSGEPLAIASILRDLHPLLSDASTLERELYQAGITRLASQIADAEFIEARQAARWIESILKTAD